MRDPFDFMEVRERFLNGELLRGEAASMAVQDRFFRREAELKFNMAFDALEAMQMVVDQVWLPELVERQNGKA